MRRLVSTIDLSKDEWLRYRKMGITGTDAGAIAGMNPYVSPFHIYNDKLSSEVEIIDNESMRQGRDLEEYVASRFSEETGLKVRKANAIYQNEEYPFMLADFDRLIAGQKAGLECKTVSPYSESQWKDGAIPIHYQMQVQHYLAVSGFDCWYVAALVLGRDFIIRKIERDEELINYLIQVEKRFWNENVMKQIMPDPDGTKECSEQIAKMYFKSDERKTVQLTGYNQILERRKELVELMDKLDKEKTEIDQKIKLEMQDASYAFTEDFKVSWVSVERKQLDSKRLKTEDPDMYEKYSTSVSSRRFMVNAA